MNEESADPLSAAQVMKLASRNTRYFAVSVDDKLAWSCYQPLGWQGGQRRHQHPARQHSDGCRVGSALVATFRSVVALFSTPKACHVHHHRQSPRQERSERAGSNALPAAADPDGRLHGALESETTLSYERCLIRLPYKEDCRGAFSSQLLPFSTDRFSDLAGEHPQNAVPEHAPNTCPRRPGLRSC